MVNLSSQLREGTKKSHTMAENTGFVLCFLKGVVDKSSYRNLVSDLYFVYSAMEEEMDNLESHPVIGMIAYKQLYRKRSLELDLCYYYGSDWEQLIKPSVPCQKYVARIREISKTSPELLVGHHYTRYLGDLSGGQVLKNIAKKSMGIGDEGLNFYIFDDIDNEKEFKILYRETLDQLPIDQEMADKIVEEANYAFKLNMIMFNELEGNLIKAIGKILFSFLTDRKRVGSTEND